MEGFCLYMLCVLMPGDIALVIYYPYLPAIICLITFILAIICL